MYEDGSKESIFTYHLLDLLSYPVLEEHQIAKLINHLTEEKFLGDYGMFSISKKDLKHFDLLDCDFGGGGYYAGMPPKIARALYKHGLPEKRVGYFKTSGPDIRPLSFYSSITKGK